VKEDRVLINPTLQKLNDLGLSGMAFAFGQQLEQPEYLELSFEDRLGLLVDREAQDRDNRRLQRNLKAAKLRSQACIEDLDFRRPRGLDRSTMLSLAEAHWVEAHRDILVTGATGVGKTFIACALAQAALRHRHRVLYLRVPRLLEDLRVARADGRLPRLMTSWSRIEVLVLDDLALRPLAAQQAADLLEIVEDRHQRRSTIVASQLPVSHWHEALGEPTVADAILDRLVHGAYRVELQGDSFRRASRSAGNSPTTADAPTAARVMSH
jgi:DNA replication protein DnaC